MRKSLIFVIMTLAPVAASAQKTWSYSDCLDYAREHNISLQKSRLDEKTSEYDLEEARAQWQPTLDFATTHGFTNYPRGEGTRNSYSSSYGLNAGWTVWNGGQRENTIRRNKLNVDIERLNTRTMLRSLETDLLQVYLNILYAAEAVEICKEAVKLSDAQAARAQQLMEAGKMSRVDFAQLDAQLEQDKYALVNAISTYDTRRMELKEILELGIDSDITPEIVEWTTAQVLDPLPPMAESYRLAIATDTRLQALDLEKTASGIDIDIAKGARLPRISLTAGVGTGYYAPGKSFGSSLKHGWNESIGLTLSIPIFDNKKTRTAIARAQVAEVSARLDIEQRQTELGRTVENWYIDTRSAQARYKAAESQLQAAALSDSLTNEKFELGYVNTVELMTAHNTYIDARHSVLQAKYMAVLGRKMIEFYRNAEIKFP